jgi:hypothetical protein
MWHWHWIKGHQDKTKPLCLLDFWACQNIYIDKLAKSFMAKVIKQQMDFDNCQFTDEGWSVAYWHEKLSRLLIGNLYQNIMPRKSLLAYWIELGQITALTTTQIDWSLVETAMISVPTS